MNKTTLRDIFMYLLLLVTLYASIVSFIFILFEYINELWPDAASYIQGASLSSLRTSVSVLLVMFPVYLGLAWFLRKDIIANPEKRDFGFRKFVVYLTLFLAALTAIVDIIILLNEFLDGALTLHFFFKVLAVLLVAGAVFAYYLWDLRRPVEPGSRPSRAVLILACAVVFGSVLAGFFIIGSPWEQRMRRFDDQRVSNLENIQYMLIDSWSRTGSLPAELASLNDAVTGYSVPLDPETQIPYEYRKINADSFELCAVFSLVSDTVALKQAPRGPYGIKPGTENFSWEHQAGRQCFSRTLDPQKHKRLFP